MFLLSRDFSDSLGNDKQPNRCISERKALMASHLEMKNRSSHSPPVQTSSKQTMASSGGLSDGATAAWLWDTVGSRRFCPQLPVVWRVPSHPGPQFPYIVTLEDLQGTSEPSTSLQSLGYLIYPALHLGPLECTESNRQEMAQQDITPTSDKHSDSAKLYM